MQVPKTQTGRAADLKNFPGFAAARDAANWPDRRRGHSNFLTWAFFLSEVLAADLFFGGGAKAAEALGDPSQHANGAHPSDSDASSGIDWEANGDPKLDPGAQGNAGHMALPPGFSLQAGGETSSFHLNGGGGASAGQQLAGGGAGSASALMSDHHVPDGLGSDGSDGASLLSGLDPGAASEIGLELNTLNLDADLDTNLAPGPLVNVDAGLNVLGFDVSVETSLLSGLGLEPDLDGIGGSAAQLIDGATGLNLGGTVEGLTGLLSTAQDELGGIGEDATGIATNLVPDSIGTVASIVPDAAPLGSLSDTGDLAPGHAIVFPDVTASVSAAPDTLFVGAQYTDYNLALQTDVGVGGNHVETTDSTSGETSDALSVDIAAVDQASIEHATGDALAGVSNAEHDLLRGL